MKPSKKASSICTLSSSSTCIFSNKPMWQKVKKSKNTPVSCPKEAELGCVPAMSFSSGHQEGTKFKNGACICPESVRQGRGESQAAILKPQTPVSLVLLGLSTSQGRLTSAGLWGPEGAPHPPFSHPFPFPSSFRSHQEGGPSKVYLKLAGAASGTSTPGRAATCNFQRKWSCS